MKTKNSTTSIQDQFIAIGVNQINQLREDSLNRSSSLQDRSFELAMDQMTKLREFVSEPREILGSLPTKHGEIAEQVEVACRNAQQAIEEQVQDESLLNATFNGVGRTATEDYLIDGVGVQSKFINGLNNNLRHVLQHLNKYPDYAKNENFYHLPKDQWKILNDIKNNIIPEGLSEKTIKSIKTNIAQLEEMTGRSFDDLIRPGVSDYSEVQLGKIDNTIAKHEKEFSELNQEQHEKIINEHQPSLKEVAKSSALGAVIGGGISLSFTIYKKYKDGKNIFRGDFTKEDWREIGISTFKGSMAGGISAGVLYALTNYASMSAPFASAFISASKGIGSLGISLQNGDLSIEEFTDLGLIICSESAIIGIMTITGQTVLPIPVIGALIGVISGKFLASVAKNINSELSAQLNREMEHFKSNLKKSEKQTIDAILSEFNNLGELTLVAFDIEINKQLLLSSIDLARAHKVKEAFIIKNESDLDTFMLT